MKKNLFSLLLLPLFLSGCVSIKIPPDSPEVSSPTPTPLVPTALADTPWQALVQEGFFQGDLAGSTDLHLEKIPNAEGASELKVILKQDGLMDDSIKSETYELYLKQQADGSWLVSDKKLIDTQCYRGEVDGLCL